MKAAQLPVLTSHIASCQANGWQFSYPFVKWLSQIDIDKQRPIFLTVMRSLLQHHWKRLFWSEVLKEPEPTDSMEDDLPNLFELEISIHAIISVR